MRIIMFYHSLLSDWNYGNAHFLRGIATELIARGHEVLVYEPRNAWSVQNMVADHGIEPIRAFRAVYPWLENVRYDLDQLDLDDVLKDSDLVMVHEWNDSELIRRIGDHHRRTQGYRLLFHDTHHRAVTDPASIDGLDLACYDGVLAFGQALRDVYLQRKWAQRAWVWHEAADTRVFFPLNGVRQMNGHGGDLVWIDNWGDEERAAELIKFFIRPVRALHIKACAYGARYPPQALKTLRRAGIEYRGWLPNYRAPNAFSHFRATVHIPRRPYTEALQGIPTIRPFEALACGIPLISAPWEDSEGLFEPGQDFLIARDESEMEVLLREIIEYPTLALQLARHGRSTVLDRHTCAHRVHELLGICRELGIQP